MNKILLALLLGFASFTAHAGMVITPTINVSSTTESDNRVFAGLKWTLNKGSKPEVVVGYRHARVESNGDTYGGEASLSFTLLNGIKPGKFRTKYFNGQDKVQGEVSAGYDFANGLFAGIGVNAPFSNIGVDYLYSSESKWQPYFMLNTLGKHDKPEPRTTLSCPNTYVLNAGNCDPVFLN